MVEKLEEFVNTINGEHLNSCLYQDAIYERCCDLRVTFKRNHKEYYNQLLQFCADNGLMVISTNPATYATIVRIEEG